MGSLVAAVSILLALLTLLAVFEGAITQQTRLGLRVLAEKYAVPKYALLERIATDRRHFLIPLQFGIQLMTALVAILVSWYFFASGWSHPLVLSAVCAFGIVTVVRQWIPYLVTHRNPERVLLRLLPAVRGLYSLLSWLSWPVTRLLSWARTGRDSEDSADTFEEDATDEEIQAYLGVGEEEGIFDGAESRLIQSALEFGTTLVREIMTPRNEIVAIDENATLSELKDLIVSSKHSRIPVYRDQIDQIVGIVYVRNLLSRLEPGQENDPITPIITEVLIVPESKKVAALLKELQAGADQMAIVVNEYGTVSGLVTVEDLLEEIVGDIMDEDESRRTDLAYEGGGNYIVRGGIEVCELEEAMGVDFGEHEASTVSGMVVDHLGKVPAPGESLLLDGALIEILSADHRKIHKMRVRLLEASPGPGSNMSHS